MKYIPKKEGNKWITETCSGNGNMGIHDQSQFKSAVAMLEEAAASWDSAMLNHIVLTGADEPTYQRFIARLTRHIRLPALKAWKSAIEVDKHKGLHCHVMLVLSSAKHERLLGDADNSTFNRIKREIQATVPTFDALRIQPKRHSTPYIPLDDNTFNDAVEWCSYIFKVRSKPQGRCYLSSRPARRACMVKVDKSVSPPVCLAVSTVKETNFKNIRFPTSARGKKCSKTPVFKGISHFIAILPTILHHKTCQKQHEIGVKSHFIGDLQPQPRPASHGRIRSSGTGRYWFD